MVYVLSKEGNPLMPCENVVGRLLLKHNKAKVKMTTPFVIQLTIDATDYKQWLKHGIDPGSKKLGSAVVTKKAKVVYMSVVEVRNDVTEKMTRRAKYRRNRRNRKTRYRQARFDNRGNSKRTDRFSPTMTSKYDSHMKEIEFVKSILPITETVIETASFDPHAMKNPEVLSNPLLYQQGINYGYENTKAYVLDRDGYKCQNSGCKSKEKRLEVHHIIFRCDGGSDEPENLIVMCKVCHDGIHDGSIKLNLKGKRKGQLIHATQMNSIRVQLLKRVPGAEQTFGYITKAHRQNMKLPKEHYNDAVAIACGGMNVEFKTNTVLLKKCVSDGDYQLRKGVRSEMVIPTGKIQGFRKFDKVKHNGKCYFIKGRIATGYTILMNIEGNKVDLKPIPKMANLKRVSARKAWLTDSKTINNGK